MPKLKNNERWVISDGGYCWYGKEGDPSAGARNQAILFVKKEDALIKCKELNQQCVERYGKGEWGVEKRKLDMRSKSNKHRVKHGY